MMYPILYTRDSTGKIRTWQMEQEGNTFRTISGVQGGALVTSEWTTTEGKNLDKANATTGAKQAQKECEAKYKKQRKTGYHDDIADVDTEHYFQVMLAKSLKDYENKIDWATGVIVQIKFNGFRCVARREGLFTRKGEKYISVPHIEYGLSRFFEHYPEAILDGELFNYDYRQFLNKISELCRKTKNVTDEDLKNSEQLIRYYVYDAVNFVAKPGAGYLQRKKPIDILLPDYTDYVRHVEDHVVHSRQELDAIYQTFLADEQEGAIVRILGVPYENKRSKYLLKYKPLDDMEITILDIMEGTGNWSGTGKVLRCKAADGRVFDATFKGNYEDCKQFFIDKNKWIGREVTIIYNGLTGLGIPNYARLDFSNCIKV